MVAWSGLFRSTGQILLRGCRILPKNLPENGILQKRLMSEHRIMPLEPSRWQWHKTKDLVHLYFMVGIIPVVLTVFFTHMFIGPAELTKTPEGYEPKHWEYYRDPISRFIARYIWTSPQQEYEKYCHFLWTEGEIMKIRQLEDKIHMLMSERHDYQAWYYQPYEGKYSRRSLQVEDEHIETERGGE